MARSTSQIQNQILRAIQSDPNLINLDSTSAVSIYNLWAYYIASSQAFEEQLNDQFVTEVENTISKLAPGTPPWIQDMSFKFQYNSASPQVIQFNPVTFSPYYTTVNPGYRIITNCSVTNGTLNSVNVKVAKGTTGSDAQPLSADELSAFQFYLKQIEPAGINYDAISIPSDKLMCRTTVYYQSVYSSVIGVNLLNAYKTYLNNIPFGGGIKIVDLIGALRAVEGVRDVIINDAVARANSVPFGGGTALVTANTWASIPEYQTLSGYIADETTSGYDFASLLVLNAV